jgi:hypothetical protein
MKLKYKLRSLWEEFKLRLRVMRAAAGTFMFLGDCTPVGRLTAVRISADGKRESLGLICTKVVTTAAVDYLVAGLQSSATDVSLFKYHASGTSSTAESAADTTLGVEVESRAVGSQTVGASNNIYKTVGTISYTGTHAIVEHGVLTAASVGTLLDRSVFTAINVVSGDSIQFTYELTLPSGS